VILIQASSEAVTSRERQELSADLRSSRSNNRGNPAGDDVPSFSVIMIMDASSSEYTLTGPRFSFSLLIFAKNKTLSPNSWEK
jgi:hypothetical protein